MASYIIGCKQGPSMEVADQAKEEYYKEPYRPQFHFSPEANWMNDPNGMVYYEGEYHLFYQYYPDSTVWGPMHWGHAVSKDMVHWEHLPIALYPDSLGLIFSGSAVIDWKNTTGFGSEENPPMIAIFTHHLMEGEKAGRNDFQYQSIAYSLDKGRTWTKYDGNPVVPNPGIKDFRDPKVIWDKSNDQWVMTFAAYDKVRFYTSKDLKEWKFTGTFGIEGDDRLWECPDLIPMTIKETGEEQWVLIVSIQRKAPNGGTATGYFIGDWDGKTFIGDPSDQKWLDWGTDNYALVTWADVPEDDGRTLAIGWMSNWQYAQVVPTQKWRSAMTLPRALTLHDDGIIRSLPVKELKQIEISSTEMALGPFSEETILAESCTTCKYEISVDLKSADKFAFRLSNSLGEYTDVGFHSDHLFIDRSQSGDTSFSVDFPGIHKAPVEVLPDQLDFLIYTDHSSIEIFVNGGIWVMTDIVFPSEPYDRISLISQDEKIKLTSSKYAALSPIWPQ